MEENVGRYNELDPDTEARVEALLARMTLDEKVGQLVQISPYAPFDPEHYEAQQREAEGAGEPFHYIPPLREDMEALLRAGASAPSST